MFDAGSAGRIGDESLCSSPTPFVLGPAFIVAACIAAFVLVLGMVVFRLHWQRKTPPIPFSLYEPLYEKHQDTTTTVGGTRSSIRLFKTGADCAVQITRPDDARIRTIVPSRYLIQQKQLCLSKEVLGGGSSGIVKKGTFGSCAVAVKHVSLHFIKEDHLKRRRRGEGEDPILKSFQRECEVFGSLAHPNCVAFYGFSFTPDWFLLVMELCTGEDSPSRNPHPHPSPSPSRLTLTPHPSPSP
jgi:serine/threonine protein kinase